jgi:hypothetical protein
MPRKLRFRKTRRPEFSIPDILAWADAYHRRTGKWPKETSGPILEGPLGDTWHNVDTALRLGLRGLDGESSLAQLLNEHRQVRNPRDLPKLTRKQILAWADAFKEREGSWPTSESGPIPEAPGETWRSVDRGLRVGARGLRGGSSLARLLERARGVRNIQSLPRLSTKQILAWADAHHKRTGTWPTSQSGEIIDAPGESWAGVHSALYLGRRGLPGGSSLARLLAKHRGIRNPKQLPHLTIKQILAWARAHHRRTGRWPHQNCGPIPEAPGETWSAVDSALQTGYRGLPSGLTLAALLADQHTVPKESPLPKLKVEQILAWADAHYQRTGSWPHARSGHIPEAPEESWRGIDRALHTNQRGLEGGLTLAQLLSAHRGVRINPYLPPLSEEQILAWADEYHENTDTWPNFRCGEIPGTSGETWRAVDEALRRGCRGVRGGRSLALFLARKRGVRNRRSLPPLRLKQIVAWADAHHQRTGRWPNNNSGPIVDAPGETWKGVALALAWGYRKLRGGTTLARLLARERGVRNRSSLPSLSYQQILTWADAHYQRNGSWPSENSGPIGDSVGETWHGVDQALRGGYRGLPYGSSLAQLLRKYRRTAKETSSS